MTLRYSRASRDVSPIIAEESGNQTSPVLQMPPVVFHLKLECLT